MKIIVCDPDNYIVAESYEDEKCLSPATNMATNGGKPPILGWAPDVCSRYDASTYIILSNVSLKGNKFGLGWSDGWTIFICQTALFGVCEGY